MVSIASVERLATRIAQLTGHHRPRIGGVLVRSPKLVDGSIEVHAGGGAYAMSPVQIGRLQERFPFECGGPPTNLPTTEGRIEMTEADFAAYLTLIETERARQQPTHIIRD